MKNVQAVILSAGKGTRLNGGQPSLIPKAMFELNNKPMVWYIIQTLKNINIKKPIMVVGYKNELIKKYFGSFCRYAWQREQLGTGDAAREGVKLLSKDIKSVLIVQCDDSAFYKKETLKDLIKFQKESKSAIVVMTVERESKDYGRIVANEKGEITEIIEKEFMTPEKFKKYKLVNTGGYCFDVKWAKENFPKLKLNKLGRFDITDMIEMAAKQGKKVLVKKIPENEWIGINTPEQYLQAKKLTHGDI